MITALYEREPWQVRILTRGKSAFTPGSSATRILFLVLRGSSSDVGGDLGVGYLSF
jgi:hypothetical protein